MSVKYPFLNKQDQPINNARELYEALSFASSGFFGVGGNNFWHGGLHFSKAMGSRISLEKPVMCIGDGEVIAWRINKEYKKSSYKGMNLEYSTGFVLIQHKHKNKQDSANPISLDWYSLYMHLLPYSEYKNNAKLEKPFFYEEHSTYQSVADKSRDAESGRFLYTDEGNSFKEIIPPATTVDIEESDQSNNYSYSSTYTVQRGDMLYRIASKLVQGGHRERMEFVAAIKQENKLGNDIIYPGQVLVLPRDSGSEYIKVSYLDLFSQQQHGYIKPQAGDQIKARQIIIDSSAGERKPERGIRMRETGSSRARILLVLPHGSKFQVVTETGGSTKWGKVVAIISDKGEYRGEYGYVYLPETRLLADPEPIYDEVVVPARPINIGAGTAVGYIGKYETPNTPNGNEQVHIEVFSGDNVEAFLAQSRAATQSMDDGKTILKLPEGASLFGLSIAQPDDHVEPMLGLQITTNDKVSNEVSHKKQSDFVEVQVTGYYGIVQRSDMGSYSNGGYSVNRAQISSIQQALNTRKYTGARLKFAAYVSNDKSSFSNTNQNIAGARKHRLVFFKQPGKRVWIRRDNYKELFPSKIDRIIQYGENPIAAWSENPVKVEEVLVDSMGYDVYTHASNLNKKEINNEIWFEFEVEHPLGTNTRERGLAKQETLESYSANEWPGFKIVKESAANGMGFALNEKSANDKYLDMEAVTPIFRRMLEYIDVDGDKTLTLNEIKNGNQRLSVREILPRLIIKHPSEWQADKSLSKWSKLTELLASNKELLKHEQQRISQLVWWDEVKNKADNFPSDKNVYHFNPIGFIDNLHIDSNDICQMDENYFFSQYRINFGAKALTTRRREALKTIFSGIREFMTEHREYSCNKYKLAYMLATTKHETADTFQPIAEIGSKSYFNRYDPVLANTSRRRERAKKMGNTNKGDGYKYRGRGYVQLTWKNNYRLSGDYLGLDLVNNPDLALDHINAVKIMIYGMEVGLFTSRKLSHYINNSKIDYYNARRIINGTDKANLIKSYAEKLEKCILLSPSIGKDSGKIAVSNSGWDS